MYRASACGELDPLATFEVVIVRDGNSSPCYVLEVMSSNEAVRYELAAPGPGCSTAGRLAGFDMNRVTSPNRGSGGVQVGLIS
jgi:hypothetical protein